MERFPQMRQMFRMISAKCGNFRGRLYKLSEWWRAANNPGIDLEVSSETVTLATNCYSINSESMKITEQPEPPGDDVVDLFSFVIEGEGQFRVPRPQYESKDIDVTRFIDFSFRVESEVLVDGDDAKLFVTFVPKLPNLRKGGSVSYNFLGPDIGDADCDIESDTWRVFLPFRNMVADYFLYQLNKLHQGWNETVNAAVIKAVEESKSDDAFTTSLLDKDPREH